jgi:hypothetical protein
MSLDYIRSTYGVPAKLGGRVRYTGGKVPQLGTITGTSGAYLGVRLDGQDEADPFHPTWELEYLSASTASPEGGPALAPDAPKTSSMPVRFSPMTTKSRSA